MQKQVESDERAKYNSFDSTYNLIKSIYLKSSLTTYNSQSAKLQFTIKQIMHLEQLTH